MTKKNIMPLKKRRVITITSLIIIVAVSVVLSMISINWMSQGADNQQPKAYSYTTQQLVDNVITQMGFSDLNQISPDQLSKHYVFPDGLIKSATVYMANSSDSAFEIACFELSNEKYTEQIDKVISDHMTTKAAGFKDVSPIEYEKVQQYTVKHKGAYTFVIVGEKSDAAAKLFESMF